MTNTKQQTAVTSLIILIGVVILIWAMAKIDAVFIGVLITTLLVFMYGCIQLTIIRNKEDNNEQQ
jgi:multisubunit Na+/H+ antiporter MnhG subunit